MNFVIHPHIKEDGKKSISGRKYDPDADDYGVYTTRHNGPTNVMSIEQPAMEKYLTFLDELRLSGVTNMYQASPFLCQQFPNDTPMQDTSVTTAILLYWMSTFSIRHPRK